MPMEHVCLHPRVSVLACLAALVVLACVSCRARQSDTSSPPAPLQLQSQPQPLLQFKDVTDETGVTFVHTDGSSGRRYIVETVSAGLATFDYDGDGRIDIYFLNGAPLRGTVSKETPTNALYRNEGG
jgi:hypothetical protein